LVTSKETVRFCKACQKSVYHCRSIQEAREQAQNGRCVAVDSRLAREPGDLETPQAEVTTGFLLEVPVDPSPFQLVVLDQVTDVLLQEPARKRWWKFWK
jgi:hypothetical protein